MLTPNYLGTCPAVGLCEKSETWLLLGGWLSRDLKADKSLRGQGYFFWHGFWGTITVGTMWWSLSNHH